jgi:hypothetical protein
MKDKEDLGVDSEGIEADTTTTTTTTEIETNQKNLKKKGDAIKK